MPRSDGLPPGALRRAVGATAGPFAASITTKHFGTPFEARRGCYLAAGNPCEDNAEPGIPCPLWVRSRHSAVSKRCPLYPQKRTFGHAQEIWESDLGIRP